MKFSSNINFSRHAGVSPKLITTEEKNSQSIDELLLVCILHFSFFLNTIYDSYRNQTLWKCVLFKNQFVFIISMQFFPFISLYKHFKINIPNGQKNWRKKTVKEKNLLKFFFALQKIYNNKKHKWYFSRL